MDLISNIYENEGKNGQGMSRIYIAQYLDSILSCNKVEFITENFSRYDWTYNKLLMCSTPELWIDLSVDDWIKIFSSTRKNDGLIICKDFRDMDKFPDLLFLAIFLEINALPVFMDTQSISADQKIRFIDFFTINAPVLFKTDMDDEVLKFDMEEIGVRVFIANESVKKCKIKTNEFTFQKVIIFELRKTFLNDPFRRTALLKIVLYLIKRYTSESVFLFNGDSIIVVQAGKDILINTKDGFFHQGVAEVLNEVVYETQNYSEADFAPYYR